MQSIPPTTADKQTQAQKRRGSRSRKLLGAKAKSYRLKNYIRMVTRSTDRLAPAGNPPEKSLGFNKFTKMAHALIKQLKSREVTRKRY